MNAISKTAFVVRRAFGGDWQRVRACRRRGRADGFTLAETLIAIAVFAIGFIAVAAMFPAAAMLQKQTMGDIRADQVEDNVRSFLKSVKLNQSDLLDSSFVVQGNGSNSVDQSGVVHRFASSVNSNNVPIYAGHTLNDRSYPSSEPDPQIRSFYWVPMVRDADPDPDVHDWRIFALILKSETNATYRAGSGAANYYDNPDRDGGFRTGPIPTVNSRSASKKSNFEISINNAGDFSKNDWLLDNTGFTYRVVDVDDNGGFIEVNSFVPDDIDEIWFGKIPDGGGRSPLKRIVVLSGEQAVGLDN